MSDSFDYDQTLRGHIPGEMVFDRFKLVKTLGQGGMGVVWLAFDEQLDREVALKFLPEIVAHDPAAINDLKRETKKALKLTHPNIVRIYDFLQNDQMVAVSMEHVNGLSLTQLRLDEPNQVFSVDQIEKWVGQICQALDYAHIKEQIAHRDLKPSNLLVDEKGDLKITDFGISATISDATTCTRMNASSSGTPVYMCPQQMMGEKAAPTDDIYSLGATIYELLTGKPPFYSGRIDLQLQNKVPPSMKERRKELEVKATSEIPQEWEKAVAACLEKAAEDRPQSLAAVWDCLQGKQSIASQSKPASTGGKGGKLLKLACLLLLLGGTSAAGWYFGTGGDLNLKLPFEIPFLTSHNDDPVVPPQPDTEDTPPAEDTTVQPPLAADATAPVDSAPQSSPLADPIGNSTVADSTAPKEETTIPDNIPADTTPVATYDAALEKLDPVADTTPAPQAPPQVEEKQKEEIIFPENGPQPGNNWVLPNYGVQMNWIEPGEFMMGERSVHLVKITQGFWLGSYEVTQEQWESVMGFNPSKFRDASGNTPIDQVSWDDAMDFCIILTEMEREAGRLPKGYAYSLPTEAQWEYACRAGRNSTFSFGERLESSMANFNGNYPFGSSHKGVYRQKPITVGSFAPNEWGLYDMYGNVSEWCYDWYAKYNLRDTTDPTGAKNGSGHVTRGGAWHSEADSCTSGARDYEKPNSKNSYLGFRVALRKVEE